MKTSFAFRALAVFLFVALLISGVQGSSTPTAHYGTLTGVLRDADTHEPIPGTNVVLISSSGKQLVCSAKTRPDGTFRLEKVPFGSYSIRTTVLGYQLQQPKVTFNAKQAHVVLGTLSLQPMNTPLLALSIPGR
ncbi:carboxypeptidase regulatory-like domain-containing protein [Hymenobacter cellulosivorans]|uniref:Carboxypeptidase-like regulatory domain-containing protein n=1 Tax=Hymenobacter cellulosivorans TaxID=2932249 RepID=A0ABY4F503_9BACT|nr:carboxypeptidase regulatory-like domain-containing protein [Hymenobacter cellulosivorans]UOQ51222.1 carboxypeptidase-like regulatory domain-containing protein [Hymenobacter cellulosivorans]